MLCPPSYRLCHPLSKDGILKRVKVAATVSRAAFFYRCLSAR